MKKFLTNVKKTSIISILEALTQKKIESTISNIKSKQFHNLYLYIKRSSYFLYSKQTHFLQLNIKSSIIKIVCSSSYTYIAICSNYKRWNLFIGKYLSVYL